MKFLLFDHIPPLSFSRNHTHFCAERGEQVRTGSTLPMELVNGPSIHILRIDTVVPFRT
jgi:hypothetical protein